MTRRFWGTRRSQWGRVPIFPGPTHLRLSFGGGFTVVAPLGAALEFFENRACPGTADSGVSRHPENQVPAVRGRWVGRGWGYGSAAPGGPGACLGLPPVRFLGRWHRLVGRDGLGKWCGGDAGPIGTKNRGRRKSLKYR